MTGTDTDAPDAGLLAVADGRTIAVRIVTKHIRGVRPAVTHIDMVDDIEAALRSERVRGEESMRDRAAAEAAGWTSTISGHGTITHQHANEIMATIGPNIAEAIRALPTTDQETTHG